jgi:hypothetical protein
MPSLMPSLISTTSIIICNAAYPSSTHHPQERTLVTSTAPCQPIIHSLHTAESKAAYYSEWVTSSTSPIRHRGTRHPNLRETWNQLQLGPSKFATIQYPKQYSLVHMSSMPPTILHTTSSPYWLDWFSLAHVQILVMIRWCVVVDINY